MTIALLLAEFARETKTLPEPTRRAAIRATFDLFSAAVAGFGTAGGAAARRAALSTWGAGPAQAWFSSARLTVPGAAFANAAIASMVDLDDGHRAAAGHPGAAVIPTVFATADFAGSSVDEMLTAVALGYEIGVRVSAARDFAKLETLDSGLWCGLGVAVAASALRDLGVRAMANAIAIAGTTAPSQSATCYTRLMGNNVKEGIPWATAAGLTAVDLAASGFTGPVDLLDDDGRYKQDVLTQDLGRRWQIEDVYFKSYGCCRWAHAAIDAVLALQEEQAIPANAIASIEVGTFTRALTLNNDVDPPTIEAAQYSIPFCIALAAVYGVQALQPIEEEVLGDPKVLALARRIRLFVDPELDPMFSKAVPARIELRTSANRFTKIVLAPKGEPSNPMSRTEVTRKFETIARPRMGERRVAQFLEAFAAFEAGDAGPLRSALTLALGVRAQARAPGRVAECSAAN